MNPTVDRFCSCFIRIGNVDAFFNKRKWGNRPMSYVFHEQISSAKMDAFVMASGQNSLFQCSDWAKMKANWQSMRTGVYEEDHLVASALILIRKLPMGASLFYIPRGPVMDYHNEALVTFFLDHLTKIGKRNHAVALRFDPCILLRSYPYRQRTNPPLMSNQDIITFLQHYGAKHKGYTVHIEESTQPRFNAEMDVTEDYRQHLEHKTAKCIRAAMHKGIQVYEGPQYVHDLAVAMRYTEIRKKVALRGEDYFRHMLDVYGDHAICMVAKLNFPKQIEILAKGIKVAEEKEHTDISQKEKKLLRQQIANDQKELERLQKDYQREGKEEVITCGILAVYNDALMELFYMGNHPDYMRMYSSYLLYASCLDRCVSLGITHCSFGGIEGTLDDGLTLFKSNWLMNVEEYIGEFNLVFRPLFYKAFISLYPSLLKFAAKMRGKKKSI